MAGGWELGERLKRRDVNDDVLSIVDWKKDEGLRGQTPP